MTGTVRVANYKSLVLEEGEAAYYIGRGRVPSGMVGTPLGNPFVVGQGYVRGEAVVAYERKLRQDCREKNGHYGAVQRLARLVASGQNVVLVCWCHPRPCHGDVLKRAIEGYARKQAE